MIPGVDRASAITVISEIGTDMSQFANSKRLCCWAGLSPGNNESVRISRAGAYLKPALVQIAHAAVKSHKSPYYKIKLGICKMPIINSMKETGAKEPVLQESGEEFILTIYNA